LKDEFNGKTIIEKLQHKIWNDTDCALAVMSADDELKILEVNARPNVLFEIGYCLGYFEQLHVGTIRGIQLHQKNFCAGLRRRINTGFPLKINFCSGRAPSEIRKHRVAKIFRKRTSKYSSCALVANPMKMKALTELFV
jgi:hypothetical protein